MTWHIALTKATFVPGRTGRCSSASTWGERTRSIRRGSATITLAPSRRRRFIREANTGWASVGLAPMTSMTSAESTEAKSWVPAEVPNAWLRP